MAEAIVRRASVGARALQHREFLERREFNRLLSDDWFSDEQHRSSIFERSDSVYFVTGWRTRLQDDIDNARNAEDLRKLKLARARIRRAERSPEQREAFLDSQRRSYAKKPEYYAAMRKAWADSHSEQMREYRKVWKAKNLDKVNAARRAWYAANREKQVAKSVAWQKANREKRNAADRARAAKKRERF
jgi:hypothetical protein